MDQSLSVLSMSNWIPILKEGLKGTGCGNVLGLKLPGNGPMQFSIIAKYEYVVSNAWQDYWHVSFVETFSNIFNHTQDPCTTSEHAYLELTCVNCGIKWS